MSDLMATQLAQVTERVQRACALSGRGAESVRVVAVSKLQPVEALRAAYNLGVRDFGENYVQELARKRVDLPPDIRWHFIGRLQSNKAKLLRAGPLAWLHALDSTSQVKALRAARALDPLDVLIEVNIGDESSKGGVAPDALFSFVDEMLRAEPGSLRLRGLMTMPPWTEDPQAVRPIFARLRALLDGLRDRYPDQKPLLTELSMGMSHDLEAAISEGATMVRVGTAIFGERPQRL